jgi:hypothetical protein
MNHRWSVYRIAAGVQSLAPNRWHWLAHMLIDPVSRLGASRGLWPVPGTASITHLNWNPTTPNWPGAAPRFFSIQCVGPPGLSDFALHYYRGLRPRQRVFQPSGLRTIRDSDQLLPVSRSELTRSESLHEAIVKRLSVVWASEPARTGVMRPPSFLLKTNAHHDPSNAAGVPVSRLGASRGLWLSARHRIDRAAPMKITSLLGPKRCVLGG